MKIQNFSKYILPLLFILSILSIGRIISNTFSELGGIDFHAYWYNGHFLRQEYDPYKAFFTKQELSTPIVYLDGKENLDAPIAQPGLSKVPAITPLLPLVLSIFSLFSWSTAKLIWMICNLILIFLIPFLLIELLPDQKSISLYNKITLLLGFTVLLGTRNAAGNGQTTLLIFSLMLLTLISVKKYKILAGILLAFALSKYSLSLPVVLLLMIDKEYKTVFLSIIIQFLGFYCLSLLTHSSILSILHNYYLIIKLHVGLSGIHIASLFPGNDLFNIILTLIFTLIVWFFIINWLVKNPKKNDDREEWNFILFHLLTIMSIWTLLFVYHRVYDTVIYILFVCLVLYGIRNKKYWDLSSDINRILMLFLIFSFVVLSLPGQIMSIFFNENTLMHWYNFSSTMITLTLLFSLGISIYLLYQIKMNYKIQQNQISI